MQPDYSHHAMFLMTVQGAAIKTLFESLKGAVGRGVARDALPGRRTCP